jgi:hypothetical protein
MSFLTMTMMMITTMRLKKLKMRADKFAFALTLASMLASMLACVLLVPCTRLYAQLIPIKSLRADGKTPYHLRLTSGDLLTGTVAKIITLTKSDREAEDGVVLQTVMGDLTIYASEIAEITPRTRIHAGGAIRAIVEGAMPNAGEASSGARAAVTDGLNRHAHRVYIMPTAEPIAANHFVGLWQLVGLYGGVGLGQHLSLTAGRTLIPTLLPNEQITLVNLKATLYSAELDQSGLRGTLALGGNLTLANAENQIWNAYCAMTFSAERTAITALVFAKIGEPSLYSARAQTFFPDGLNFRYDAGSMGLGFGLDTRLTERNDLHFIAELWSPVLAARTASVLALAGIRLCNTTVAMDLCMLGSVRSDAVLIVPTVSFAWTPF